MPRVILKLGELSYQNEVFLQQTDDAKPVKLTNVESFTLSCDGGGPPMLSLSMYAPDSEHLVTISEATSEAIVSISRQRQLSFLSEEDVEWLKQLRRTLVDDSGWTEHDARIGPLDKILAELAKREDIPF